LLIIEILWSVESVFAISFGPKDRSHIEAELSSSVREQFIAASKLLCGASVAVQTPKALGSAVSVRIHVDRSFERRGAAR
jgi:hypothetical protein